MRNRAPASVTFVLVTLGLDALGVGIIAPIVPQLVQQLGHLSPDRAAPWVGTLLAVYAAVQFFAAPVLGGLCDRFGRRPVILASVFGLGCDYVLWHSPQTCGGCSPGGWLRVRPRPTWQPQLPTSPMSHRKVTDLAYLGLSARRSGLGLSLARRSAALLGHSTSVSPL